MSYSRDMSRIETLKTSTCADCGEQVSYVVTPTSGTWRHTHPTTTPHPANPVSMLPASLRPKEH